MNKDRYSWLRFLAGPALTLLIATGLLVPASSLAAMNASIGNGDSGGYGREGDPLDSNDNSGGGGGGSNGDDPHEQSAVDHREGGAISILPFLSDARQYLLIPEFQSGTLVFRLVILDSRTRGWEE